MFRGGGANSLAQGLYMTPGLPKYLPLQDQRQKPINYHQWQSKYYINHLIAWEKKGQVTLFRSILYE